MANPPTPFSVVVAGGGTAGHVEPALAVADALRASSDDVTVTALGTSRGLETTLVPSRGYRLELIPPVPLPRKLSADLFKLPGRILSSVRQTRAILRDVDADVIVGFGGYVSLPAYLAAALPGRRRPIVIHEANARAGLANKVGSRVARRTLAAVPNSGLDAEVVGVPVRASVAHLDRASRRAAAREALGLDPDAPVLLVFGGSQGARSINEALLDATRPLAEAGIGVLHAVGAKNADLLDDPRSHPGVAGAPAQVRQPYLDMHLAYAAADAVVCRAGALTVAEVTSVGLPALYVPLPHGNGEQALNARPVVDAGGGELIADADLTAAKVVAFARSMLDDPAVGRAAGERAASAGGRGAAETVAVAVWEAAGRTAPESLRRLATSPTLSSTTAPSTKESAESHE